MGRKSKVTAYYREKEKRYMYFEEPTPEEALESTDFATGINLLGKLLPLMDEYRTWHKDYLFTMGYSQLSTWAKGLEPLGRLSRVFYEERPLLEGVLRRMIEMNEAINNNMSNPAASAWGSHKIKKAMPRGGKREGSGRKKVGSHKITIRIPEEMYIWLKEQRTWAEMSRIITHSVQSYRELLERDL